METRMKKTFALLFLFSMPHAAEARELCTVFADAETGKVFFKRGEHCDQRVTPASSFKIAISLMGFDSGFLKDEHSPRLPFKQGYPDWRPSWREATDPAKWMKESVVWFSQQITQALGPERFAKYVRDFGYGNEDASGDAGKDNGLTRAWLSSSLKISPLEQIAFLEKIVNRRLPVSASAYEMTGKITLIDAPPAGWELHGKTGSGAPVLPGGAQDEAHFYGWFVGWGIKGQRKIVFARLTQDEKREAESSGLRARDGLLKELPSILNSQSD
ncbi:class D beta-lactamase [Methylocystis heyeri]|uniref:Beta-lactamase n=1 Tax=Methylocystis heyeri TaxID=391905 RepID=A0A6B8KLZ1_9HYPH|nr:class D beta-lactamase [Methylocystis heyeri]